MLEIPRYIHCPLVFFSALKTVAFDLSKEAISTHVEKKIVAEPKKKVTPIPRQVISEIYFRYLFFGSRFVPAMIYKYLFKSM